MENQFIKKSFEMQENKSYTENGALSYKSIGSVLKDQFSIAGSSIGRDIDTVWKDQELLWNEDERAGLIFPFYLRMISRTSKINSISDTKEAVKGCGLRDEAFKRLLWLEEKHPEKFYSNIWILPYIGSWKDLVTLYVYNNLIDVDFLFGIIGNGLENKDDAQLIWKYMPRIISGGKIKNSTQGLKVKFAKEFCKFYKISHKEYRKLKAKGTAHQFQRDICSKNYNEINWDLVPGIALNKLASTKIFENHEELMSSYKEWLEKQEKVKFNGFPHELARTIRSNSNIISNMTVDAQFKYLIEQVKNNGGMPNGNILCAVDTSGSMSIEIPGATTTSSDIANSLAIYFSELTEGSFHNKIIMFDNISKFKTLDGTFSEKYLDIEENMAMGGTNFQSIINAICDLRMKYPDIPLEDYPTTLLVVSDMQFNPSNYYGYYGTTEKTNIEASRDKLRDCFPSEWVDNFRFIWWNCFSRGQNDYPADDNDTNSLFLSGFDGSIISMLTNLENKMKKENKKKNVSYEDLIQEALNQDIFNLIQ